MDWLKFELETWPTILIKRNWFKMDPLRKHLVNGNDTRRIFLHPHGFYHHFHYGYGGPHFGAPLFGGFMDGWFNRPFFSIYGYGYGTPYYGYGYPGFYSYY
ncbi:hypothetical protein [Neobacillus drentensis]|uniref:hypothetical protein n=1 Tax=Neobacillus drentensis TaxID=220684 RepID=UPI0030002CA6